MTPTISGKPIPPEARALLSEVIQSAGVESCTVTSVGRSVEDQARVMYENCIGSGVGQGPEAQQRLYRPPGQAVVQVFIDNSGKSRDSLIELMAAKIREVGPGNVSHHICDAEHFVFDVGPSSIPADKRGQFVMAAKDARRAGKITKFLEPPADPAYHFEIPVTAT